VEALRRKGWTSRSGAICERIAASYPSGTKHLSRAVTRHPGTIANRFDLGGANCVIDAAWQAVGGITLAVDELRLNKTNRHQRGADALNDIFMYMCLRHTGDVFQRRLPLLDIRRWHSAG